LVKTEGAKHSQFIGQKGGSKTVKNGFIRHPDRGNEHFSLYSANILLKVVM